MAIAAKQLTLAGYRTLTADYTVSILTDRNAFLDVSASGAARTITLPSAATAGAGFQVAIAKSDTSSNAVTIARAGSDTINGKTSRVLPGQFHRALLTSDGVSTWREQFQGLLDYTGTPSYDSTTGTQNNYNVGSNRDVFLDIGASTVTITGFSATPAYNGRPLRVWFQITSGNLVFTHESGLSSASNRIDVPGTGNAVYSAQSGFADFAYDSQSSRWRLLGEGDRYVYFTNGIGATNLATNQLTVNPYTLATRPSASSVAAGTIIYVSDWGVAGCYLKSDGTYWASAFRQLMHRLTVPVDYTGSTTSQILSAFLVPAGITHPNGIYIMTGIGGRSAGTANNASPQLRVGGNAIGTSTLVYSNGSTSMQVFQRYLVFLNSLTQQVCANGGNTSYGVNGSLPTDLGYNFSSSDQYLSGGGALSNGADTLRLQMFTVEYM